MYFIYKLIFHNNITVAYTTNTISVFIKITYIKKYLFGYLYFKIKKFFNFKKIKI